MINNLTKTLEKSVKNLVMRQAPKKKKKNKGWEKKVAKKKAAQEKMLDEYNVDSSGED